MITGQRVVCIKQGEWQVVGGIGEFPRNNPVKGSLYTISGVTEFKGVLFIRLEELGSIDSYCSKHFIPLDENWTEEVIANVLKKQLTEPVNNGLHFSQIIG